MTATVWEYILYFFIYAFMGWMTEGVFAALRSHTLVNRGFLNGPVCPVYGFGMVAMLVLLGIHAKSPLVVFAVGVIVPTLVELIAGALLYGLFHARWWDYSDKKFNIGGFICLQFSLAWGAASIFMVMVLHPPIARLVAAIPDTAQRVVGIVLLVIFAADVGVSAAESIGLDRRLRQMDELRAAKGFTQLMVSHDLGMVFHHATHVICLKRHVFAEGTPDEVLTQENLMALFGMHMGLINPHAPTADQPKDHHA